MGRKRKYFTEEEKQAAQNSYAMSYYERNKDIIKEKAKKKYYERVKSSNLQNDQFN